MTRLFHDRFHRREALLLGASGAAWLAFSGSAFAQVWERFDPARKLIGEAKPSTNGVALDLPLVSEDGSSVQLTVNVDRPMLDGDSVQAIHLFATRNPSPEIASFEFTPRAGRANVMTRVRLNESQAVIAVARTSKGEVLVASRDVRVTQSGCLVRADTYESAAEMQPRVRVPAKAAAGAPVEILTLINHSMETGLREGPDGKILPQRIVRSFEATLDGEPFFKAALHRSLAANPYLRFFVAPGAGATKLAFRWTEDTGRVAEASASIAIG